ncbi:major facilitator superfamily protein [Striga asiatica]|uniref:Major facilitator superfamily protein n=1 Tax=Striga asiatica TaxID=4170 RepID=A0A5A7RFB2_STRAF|nr:major facilitator superfamily protein [Striga asiatica]
MTSALAVTLSSVHVADVLVSYAVVFFTQRPHAAVCNTNQKKKRKKKSSRRRRSQPKRRHQSRRFRSFLSGERIDDGAVRQVGANRRRRTAVAVAPRRSRHISSSSSAAALHNLRPPARRLISVSRLDVSSPSTSTYLPLRPSLRRNAAVRCRPSRVASVPSAAVSLHPRQPPCRLASVSRCLWSECVLIEFSEWLSSFGIATSLIIYLPKVIGQDVKTAAKNVNYWSGVTATMPLVGAFLADSYIGRFWTVMAASALYLLGLLLLTMTSVAPALKPCAGDTCPEARKIHATFFFLAIYLIAIASGSHKPTLESFGADQFDDDHPEERKKKMSFFNWWNSALCAALIFSSTVIAYVQDHVSWAAADVVFISVMGFSVVLFWAGRPLYRFQKPAGSPFTPLARVLVAAFVKRKLPWPSGSDGLYEVPMGDKAARGRLLVRTDRLKFLDKAAIIENGQQSPPDEPNPWRLATVTQVEELKLVLNVIPIWMTTVPFATSLVQATTFFIKQGLTLDRTLGRHNFSIPPASMYALSSVGMIAMITIYDYALEPFARKITGHERGITILRRIGIGMAVCILTMSVAAAVERRRLDLVQRDTARGSTSMSIFWLAPQFLLIGIGDAFAFVGLQEFCYGELPDSMRSLGVALYFCMLGAASFASSLLITVVDRVTRIGGKSWFGKDLNSSQLDCFYWLLAGITALDVCVFAVLASRYTYKNVRRSTRNAVADCYEGEDCVETLA